MRIALDGSSSMKPFRTGVARYVVNLVEGLAAALAPEDRATICYRISRYGRRAHRLPEPDGRFRRAWIQGGLGPRRFDVAHGPDGRLLSLGGAARVVTIHDVFSLLTDEFGSERFREGRRRRYREIAAKADRILCISTWTKETYLEHHPGVDPDRVAVIPLGVEDRFRPEAAAGAEAVRRRWGIDGPYVLFVGEISRRKNVHRMLDAVEGMPADAPALVLAGRPPRGGDDFLGTLERRGLAGRVIPTGFFPDEDLPALLAGAECLLFPSLMEGFGLPVLEGQACGVPVVASDRGALPETGGGAVVTVDPEDPDSIREGVLRVLGDSGLRTRLVAAGRERVAGYRWENVARRTLDLYRLTAR